MSNDRSELNQVQQQINQRTNESLESTRRMVGLVSEAQEVGVNTMVMLDEQDEKLNRIEAGLDNIHAGMNEAEKNLDNLNKCCGICVLPWNRTRRRRPFSNSSTTYTSEKSSPVTNEPKQRMGGEEGMPTGGYINRITNDDREVEMDDNLQINDTIAAQNVKIDRIADKNEAGVDRMGAANKRTQDLLRKA